MKTYSLRVVKTHATGLDGSYVVDHYQLAELSYNKKGKLIGVDLFDKGETIKFSGYEDFESLYRVKRNFDSAFSQEILDINDIRKELKKNKR